ncbi:bifunctional RNase H/acid phosphatase [Corynebacterium sp. Marseille-Q2516]
MAQSRRVRIEADGGSRGNPGIAGSGTLVYDADTGTVLRRIAYVVSRSATNNVAEYQGLINGLEAARELGATEVAVNMDSKLVVEQMSGRWKVKHPDMKKLAAQAAELVRGFSSVTFSWVPRARNAAADELANIAMDAARSGHPRGPVELEESTPPASTSSESTASSASSDSPDSPAKDNNDPARWMTTEDPTSTFILLRHGQTSYSEQGRYSGQSDPELTELGRDQARAAAELIARPDTIDALISSPLRRARSPADAVSHATGLPVRTEQRLIELDFGTWDGLTPAEARAADPATHTTWVSGSSSTVAPPGGESLSALHRRVTGLRRDLMREYAGKTVVLVSHVNPIKSFIRQGLAGDAGCFHHLFLDLGSISRVQFAGPGGGLVRTVNLVPPLR